MIDQKLPIRQWYTTSGVFSDWHLQMLGLTWPTADSSRAGWIY